MTGNPPEPTTTFDLGDARIEDSTFDDVESSADRLAVARGGAERVFWRNVRHTPFRQESGGLNWTAIGTVATIVSIAVAVLIALLQ